MTSSPPPYNPAWTMLAQDIRLKNESERDLYIDEYYKLIHILIKKHFELYPGKTYVNIHIDSLENRLKPYYGNLNYVHTKIMEMLVSDGFDVRIGLEWIDRLGYVPHFCIRLSSPSSCPGCCICS